MDRRSFITGAASGLLLGPLAACRSGGASRSTTPSTTGSPNIVFLLADDMRWDAVGAAGNRIIQTPNLDGLAYEGVLFENNFVTTSICPTSRASILTGQYARRHEIWDFETPLSQSQTPMTYPAALRRAGYNTGFIGKWGLGGDAPTDVFDDWRGFDGQGTYFDPAGERTTHLTAHLGDQATEYIERLDVGTPFCLSVSFKAPHAQDGDPDPFQPDPRFADLYAEVDIPRPPTALNEYFELLPSFLRDSEGRRRWLDRFSTDELYQDSVKNYYRLVTGIDEVVGRIVDVLQRRGLLDETYIIFTSDNGLFLGEHGLAGKWWGYEESIRTPLIIKPAGGQIRGSTVDAMTLNIDLAPTILEIAGLKAPSADGTSLHPLIDGTASEFRSDWFYEHLFEHPGIAKSEGVRTTRYKYLRYIGDHDEEFLFDLLNDPHEVDNLSTNPDHRDTVARLRALTDDYETALSSSDG